MSNENSHFTFKVEVGENHSKVFSLSTSQEGCEALFVEGDKVTGERDLLKFINYLTNVLLSSSHSISFVYGREDQ
jgi:hypothetical protein